MSAGVNGTTCTAEEFALSISGPGNRYPNIYCLTRGDSIGLSVRGYGMTISFLLTLCYLVQRSGWHDLNPGRNHTLHTYRCTSPHTPL